MNEFKFELDDQVVDQLTGFIGIIVARAQYLYSGNTYGLSVVNDKETKDPTKIYWLEEARLKEK